MAKDKTVEESSRPRQKKAGPVSLHPLTFEEALGALVRASPKPRKKPGKRAPTPKAS